MFYQNVKLKVDSVPSVDLQCKICNLEISNHKVGCSTKIVLYPFENYMFEPGNEKEDKEYLWLVSYFRKYKEGSIWGEWIKDSLDMRVVYSYPILNAR